MIKFNSITRVLAVLLACMMVVPAMGANAASVKPKLEPYALPVIDIDIDVPIIELPIDLPPILVTKEPAVLPLRWHLDGFEMTGDPIVSPDGTLYIEQSDKYTFEDGLAAISPAGERKWFWDADDSANYNPLTKTAGVGPDGTVYAGYMDLTMAFLPNKSVKWAIDAPMSSKPAFAADGTIYMGSGGALLALNKNSGAIKWKFLLPAGEAASFAPAVASEGSIYFVSSLGNLYKLSSKGVLQWSKALTANASIKGKSNTLVINKDGLILVPASDGNLYGFTADGVLKWILTISGAEQVSAAVDKDGIIYALSNSGKLIALKPNGLQLWMKDLKLSYVNPIRIGPDGNLWLTTGSRQVRAYDKNGSAIWKYDIPDGYGFDYSPVFGKDGTVYVLSSNKLYALGKVGVDNVLLNKASLTLEAGSSDVLLATVAPDNAVNKNVVWESSNPAIATVNAQGKVTGIAEGTAIITVRTVERGRSDTAAVVVAAGAAPEAFTDTSGHWASSYIEEAVKKGITKGYPNGTFRPNGNITRAEFAVMLMNGLKPDVQGSALGFKDKAAIGSWAVKAVSQAVQLGIISGYTDGTFQPAKNISHTEMAAMIVRASGLATPEVATTGYTDDAAIPQWAKKAVAAGKAHGILVVGGEDSQVFMPKALTTRAEAVSSIVKMLQLIE